MQTLAPVAVSNPDALSLARIQGDYDGPVRRFVFSTQGTADIVNKPEVMGVEYTEKLEDGVTAFLTGFQPQLPIDIDDRHGNVLHFLRGGLNFGIREALARAYGWNLHGATYISSQRDRD